MTHAGREELMVYAPIITTRLWSFAAVTDEPPPEIAETGQQRCIIALRGENVIAARILSR